MQWVHDLAGGGERQLGDAGVGQAQVNEALQELHPHDQQNNHQELQNNGWNA